MKNIYKIAIISLLIGFATGALATPESDTDVIETQTSETISATVSERKSCDEIAAQIAELSAIEEPDTETLNTLEKLKTKQRSICNKDAGARSGRSATKMRSRSPKSPSRIRPTEQDSASQTTDPETKTNQKLNEFINILTVPYLYPPLYHPPRPHHHHHHHHHKPGDQNRIA